MYSNYNYYVNTYGGTIFTNEDDFNKYAKIASDIIDILSFNRIKFVHRLSEYETDVLNEATCEIAEFQFTNKDDLNSLVSPLSLTSSSVQDVKYTWDNNSVYSSCFVINGILINKLTYRKLRTLRFFSLSVNW